MQSLLNGEQLSWLAACPKSVPPLMADEIRALGGEVEKETHLGVHWQGTLEQAYRFCLWSRLANRLLLPVLDKEVDSTEQMYELAHSVPWHEYFSANKSIRIDFHGKSQFIKNTQFGAQKIKDAICDRFRDEQGVRPDVSKQADVRIEAQLRKGRLTLYYNFGGESLHKRGYRQMPGVAPLKENLAAAILVRAGWPQMAEEGLKEPRVFVDPMCGSGTLVMEAAMMAADVAPGLNRAQFGFSQLKEFDQKLWQELLKEARERRQAGMENTQCQFLGFDLADKQINAAQHNLGRAGMENMKQGGLHNKGKIQFKQTPLEELSLPNEIQRKQGMMVCNPPYGERLSELPQLAPLYEQLNQVSLNQIPTWKMSIITSNDHLAKAIRRPLFKRYNFMNGAIEAKLLVLDPCDERSFQQPKTEGFAKGPVEAFANRLKKNLKPLRKWAKKENIECYRVYDADIPEYAVAVDLYKDWLHVQEYVPPKTIDENKAERRLLDVLAVLPEVTGIPADQIVLKRREKQTGTKQYEKKSSVENRRFAVQEGKAQLWVNLHDYLDTGLFLDHRPTRLEIFENAEEARFLNLFCYTATASVHAALGGAVSTTSVDMSRTYLNWGRDNFALNNIPEQTDQGTHEFVQSDCFTWLKQDTGTYDIIFMDPPVFSNSKRMEGVLDIQRDHVGLIKLAMKRLSEGGILIFSTNLRKFELGENALKEFNIRNVSSKSVPKDYARRSNIHHCYHIVHGDS